MSKPSITNVDQYQVEREGNEVTIKFMDIFGDGAIYGFSVVDARKIRDALTYVCDQIDRKE